MANSASQTNITTDQLTLLSLKSQIISDPFHLLDESWSPATAVCHWVGVTCGSRHQRVKSLNFSNMALTGRIPHDFGNLTFLVSLDLGNNNFQGNLPQEMACLGRLKFLKLSFNNFSGEVPSWFGGSNPQGDWKFHKPKIFKLGWEQSHRFYPSVYLERLNVGDFASFIQFSSRKHPGMDWQSSQPKQISHRI
ncbi:hypothetical protein RDI58_013534 [Solanum bulbocastanum]|uniref:Leucine-rich repeat-containing N-terminal plant-type domain-containing protein n=1 Tax=Solanum bulbocastanum TaxID=147425 RepID=A0AAN8TL96_SOLBU